MGASGKNSAVLNTAGKKLQLICREACAGFRGNFPAESPAGKRSVAGGWFSSILLFAVTVLPYLSLKYLWIAPLIIAAFFLILGLGFARLGRCPASSPAPKGKLLMRSLIISFLLFILYFIILRYWGINKFPDVQWQWYQIQSGEFDDWHPVIHTFSIYLFALIHESEFFAACCQSAILCGCCGWFCYTLEQHNFRRWSVIFLPVLVGVSPITIQAVVALLKDSAFMIALFAVGIAMIHLWYSKGQWLEKRRNWIILALVLVYASFVRHNGIFFTVPFILTLPLIAETGQLRRRLLIFSGAVVMLCGTYMATRSVLKKYDIIHQHFKTQSFHEAIGVPMSMMTYAYMNVPEKLPPEVNAFMSAELLREKWEEYYTGDFNSVKFKLVAPREGEVLPQKFTLLGDVTPREFAELFFMTFKAAPRECMYEFFRLTSVAWSPFWSVNGWWLLTAAGFFCTIMMILTLYLLPKRGMKTLFLILPFFAYNCGTALLLMGWDHRFFWGSIIGSIPVIALLFAECASCGRSAGIEKK